MALNKYCSNEKENTLNCYNCFEVIPSLKTKGIILLKDSMGLQVLLCGDTCKKEFDIDNKGKIININKVFRLIEGGLSPLRETYYCSMRRLHQAKRELEQQNINVVFESTEKWREDDFANYYENDLDSTCYDSKRRMICCECRKLLNLDDEDIHKELFGDSPDEFSRIMSDGCTVTMYCDRDCVKYY